jgi:hypothetical protein
MSKAEAGRGYPCRPKPPHRAIRLSNPRAGNRFRLYAHAELDRQAAVVNHHRQVPYRLLRCDKSRSTGNPDAGKLLIQGDNLAARKALLPYYAGKVKCGQMHLHGCMTL